MNNRIKDFNNRVRRERAASSGQTDSGNQNGAAQVSSSQGGKVPALDSQNPAIQAFINNARVRNASAAENSFVILDINNDKKLSAIEVDIKEMLGLDTSRGAKKTEKETNDDGTWKEIEKLFASDGETVMAQRVVTYSSSGKPVSIESSETDSNGSIVATAVMFDEEARPVNSSKVIKKPDGTMFVAAEEYDKDSNVVSATQVTYSGKEVSRATINYENGKPIAKETSEINEDGWSFLTKTFYNPDGTEKEPPEEVIYSPIETLSRQNLEEITTRHYGSKVLTFEEEARTLAINYGFGGTDNYRALLESQDGRDGWFAQGYNNFRELLDDPTARSHVVEVITVEEQVNEALRRANIGEFTQQELHSAIAGIIAADPEFEKIKGIAHLLPLETLLELKEKGKEMFKYTPPLDDPHDNKLVNLYKYAFGWDGEEGSESILVKTLRTDPETGEVFVVIDNINYHCSSGFRFDENGNLVLTKDAWSDPHADLEITLESSQLNKIDYGDEKAGLSFEETFKLLKGVDYNQDAINEAILRADETKALMSELQSVNNLEMFLKHAEEPEEVIVALTAYYGGDMDKAVEEINKYFETFNEEFLKYSNEDISQDEFLKTIPPFFKMLIHPLPGRIDMPHISLVKDTEFPGDYKYTIEYQSPELKEFNNEVAIRSDFLGESFFENLRNERVPQYQERMQECEKAFTEASNRAFGENSSCAKLTDLVNSYCAKQEGAVEIAGSTMQIAGLGLSAAGLLGVPGALPLGVGLAKWGTAVKIGGRFVEGWTSQNASDYRRLSREFHNMPKDERDAYIGTPGHAEYIGLKNAYETTMADAFKAGITDAAFYASGRLIGHISKYVNSKVVDLLVSQDSNLSGKVIVGLGLGAEVITDTTLAMGTQYVINGEVSFEGAARGQLLTILSGILSVNNQGAQIDAMRRARANNPKPPSTDDFVSFFKGSADSDIRKIWDDFEATGQPLTGETAHRLYRQASKFTHADATGTSNDGPMIQLNSAYGSLEKFFDQSSATTPVVKTTGNNANNANSGNNTPALSVQIYEDKAKGGNIILVAGQTLQGREINYRNLGLGQLPGSYAAPFRSAKLSEATAVPAASAESSNSPIKTSIESYNGYNGDPYYRGTAQNESGQEIATMRATNAANHPLAVATDLPEDYIKSKDSVGTQTTSVINIFTLGSDLNPNPGAEAELLQSAVLISLSKGMDGRIILKTPDVEPDKSLVAFYYKELGLRFVDKRHNDLMENFLQKGGELPEKLIEQVMYLPKENINQLMGYGDNKNLPVVQQLLDLNIGVEDAMSISKLGKIQLDRTMEVLRRLGPECQIEGKCEIKVLQLQNNAGTEVVITKTFTTEDDTQVTLIGKIKNDEPIIYERQEQYSDGLIKSWREGANKTFEIENSPSPLGEDKNIKRSIQVITSRETGEPVQLLVMKASEVLPGAFETTLFTLSDYHEDRDVIAEIEAGALEGGEALSSVTRNPDGSITFSEDFEINGSKVQRTYTQLTGDYGSIIKSEYSYTIVDENNNTILNLERSFEKNPDGTTTTVINGKTYVTSFDDETRTIKVYNGAEETEIKIQEKIDSNESEDDQQILWETCKNLPADLIYSIGKVSQWKSCDDDNSAYDPSKRILRTGSDTAIIAHESGHMEDYANNTAISNDPGLIKIYNKEMSGYNSLLPQNIQDYTGYFSQIGGGIINTGLSEVVAEVKTLLTAYGHSDSETATRAHLLMRYFPETIAYAANKLMELDSSAPQPIEYSGAAAIVAPVGAKPSGAPDYSNVAGPILALPPPGSDESASLARGAASGTDYVSLLGNYQLSDSQMREYSQSETIARKAIEIMQITDGNNNPLFQNPDTIGRLMNSPKGVAQIASETRALMAMEDSYGDRLFGRSTIEDIILSPKGITLEDVEAFVRIKDADGNSLAEFSPDTIAELILSTERNIAPKDIEDLLSLENTSGEPLFTNYNVCGMLEQSPEDGAQIVRNAEALLAIRDTDGNNIFHGGQITDLILGTKDLPEFIRNAEGLVQIVDRNGKSILHPVYIEAMAPAIENLQEFVDTANRLLQIEDADGNSLFDKSEGRALQNYTKNGELVLSATRQGPEAEITFIAVVKSDGSVSSESRIEKYPDGTVISWKFGSGQSYEIENLAVGEFDNELQESIQVITSPETGEPEKIYHKKISASELLPGTYEEIEYTLKDYPEDLDVIDAIRNGTIEGGKVLSSVTQNPDGSETLRENYTTNGFETSREFTKSLGGAEEYSYRITDAQGNELLNIERSFAKNQDGTTTTVINGTTYEVSFDDSARTITVNNGSSVTIVNIQDKIQSNDVNGQGQLWDSCKNMPADMILQIDKYINDWTFVEDLRSSVAPMFGTLRSGTDISITAHELTHSRTSEFIHERGPEMRELVGIYHREMTAYSNSTPENMQEFIKYFSESSSAYGLGEFLSETGILSVTHGNTNSAVTTRAYMVAREFPETVAYAANKLMESDFAVPEMVETIRNGMNTNIPAAAVVETMGVMPNHGAAASVFAETKLPPRVWTPVPADARLTMGRDSVLNLSDFARLAQPGQIFNVGRDAANNNVPFPNDPAVSGKHLMFRRTGNGFEVMDFSRNGTFYQYQKTPAVDYSRVPVGTRLPKNEAVHVSSNTVLSVGNSFIDLSKYANVQQGQELTMGRHAANNIVINDAAISRQHLIIKRTGNGFEITDLSSNGTFMSRKSSGGAPAAVLQFPSDARQTTIDAARDRANYLFDQLSGRAQQAGDMRNYQRYRAGYDAANSPNANARTVYSQLLDAEYANLRKANYSTGETIRTANIDRITGADANGTIVRDQNGWHYRLPAGHPGGGESGDRFSINAVADERLIRNLDALFGPGKIDGYYKTPRTADAWTTRHDPITIYLMGPTTPKIERQIVEATRGFIRSGDSSLLSGRIVAPGVAQERSPSTGDLQNLIIQAAKIDLDFAESVKSYFTNDRNGLRASAGMVAVVERVIEMLSKSVK